LFLQTFFCQEIQEYDVLNKVLTNLKFPSTQNPLLSSGKSCNLADSSKIKCDSNGFITYLNFEHSSLNGFIDPEISKFSKLTQLILTNNSLNGEIPQLNPSLQIFHVNINQLTKISFNSYPPELIVFDTRSNLLSGTVPKPVPSSLTTFQIDANQLWGDLPNFQNNIIKTCWIYRPYDGNCFNSLECVNCQQGTSGNGCDTRVHFNPDCLSKTPTPTTIMQTTSISNELTTNSLNSNSNTKIIDTNSISKTITIENHNNNNSKSLNNNNNSNTIIIVIVVFLIIGCLIGLSIAILILLKFKKKKINETQVYDQTKNDDSYQQLQLSPTSTSTDYIGMAATNESLSSDYKGLVASTETSVGQLNSAQSNYSGFSVQSEAPY